MNGNEEELDADTALVLVGAMLEAAAQGKHDLVESLANMARDPHALKEAIRPPEPPNPLLVKALQGGAGLSHNKDTRPPKTPSPPPSSRRKKKWRIRKKGH